MTATELKSIAFTKLVQRGLTVKLNHRVRLSSVVGYQQVNLDIVAMDRSGAPVVALYVGPHKERKLIKYKMTKVRFLELASEDRLGSVLDQFTQIYIDKFY